MSLRIVLAVWWQVCLFIIVKIWVNELFFSRLNALLCLDDHVGTLCWAVNEGVMPWNSACIVIIEPAGKKIWLAIVYEVFLYLIDPSIAVMGLASLNWETWVA